MHRTLWRGLTTGVLAACLALAACNHNNDRDNTEWIPNETSTSAPAPEPTRQAPNSEIPAKCKDLPLSMLPLSDIQKILKTTITGVTHSEGVVTGGANMSSCHYTTAAARPGKIKPGEDKRIVVVSVVTGDNDDEFWNMILAQQKITVSIGVGEAGIANTGTDTPYATFKLGAWIVSISFMDEAGSVNSHELIQQLAKKFEANNKDR